MNIDQQVVEFAIDKLLVEVEESNFTESRKLRIKSLLLQIKCIIE